MQPYEAFQSRATLLPIDNIDTDQIIPARFLKVTDKAGIGANLFYDWRYDAAGNPKADFPLNAPSAAGVQILVAGANFGCGSSREHAPWALRAFGFRAVVSVSFADIFRNNALKNGLLPIAVDSAAHERVCEALRLNPDGVFGVNLAEQTLRLPDGSTAHFPIETFSKHCLLEGVDELGYILQREADIRAFEARR